jgi:membrane protease YdiL (CAAX protease family)
MKKSKLVSIFEIILLFAAFYLPGYLSQGMEVDPALFGNIMFNITYISSSIPQVLLILYIIYLRNRNSRPLVEIFGKFGIKKPEISLLWKVVMVCAGILVIALLTSFISFIPGFSEGGKFSPIPWRIENPAVLPLVFLTSLVTGYREELFFRSYLITRCKDLKMHLILLLIVPSFMFAAGHMYQGFTAFLGTFCIGCFLSVLFIRFGDLHMLAIGHGMYNFLSLILVPPCSNFLI